MSDYQTKVLTSIAEILNAYTDESQPGTWQIAYSGGKDSTVTAALVIKALLMLKPEQRKRKIMITSAQTHLDLTTDPTKQHEFKRMRSLIEQHGLPIEIVELEAKSERSFLFLVLGKGYPLPKNDPKSRWCTPAIKIEPQEKFMVEHDLSLTLLGVRTSESVARGNSINKVKVSEFYGERVLKKDHKSRTFMPVINFTTNDIWSYLAENGTPWGDAEEISQLYKDATGECGLRGRKTGADEDGGDACGARFGCIICPVVKIDKSTKAIAEKKPWFVPYVLLRETMIRMYENPKNRSGHQRNGRKIAYGSGAFTVKARMELLEQFLMAQQENETLAKQYGVEPQSLLTPELINLIQKQWQEDLKEKPWLEDAEELGLIFEQKIKKFNGFQLVWNLDYLMEATV